jgi:uncharacterized protein YoxC
MQLLTNVTLVYTGVLVLALAISLITILVYLMKISQSLGKVRETLEAVAEETLFLTPVIEEFDQLISESSEEVSQVRQHLEGSEESLAGLTGDKVGASSRG